MLHNQIVTSAHNIPEFIFSSFNQLNQSTLFPLFKICYIYAICVSLCYSYHTCKDWEVILEGSGILLLPCPRFFLRFLFLLRFVVPENPRLLEMRLG